MDCPKCGNSLLSDDRFCPECGTPAPAAGEEADTLRLSLEKEEAGTLRLKPKVDDDEEERETLNLPPQEQEGDEDLRTRRLPPDTGPTDEPQRATSPVARADTRGNLPGPTYASPVEYAPPPQVAPYQPAPPPQPPAAPAWERKVSLGDWLSRGWHVYKENPVVMSLGALLSLGLSMVTLGILAGPMLSGLYRMAFRTMRGERPEIGDLFEWEGRFLQNFLAFLIFAVANGLVWNLGGKVISTMAIFVFVPLLVAMFAQVIPLILDRRMDIAAAIGLAWRMVISRDTVMWWVVGLVFLMVGVGGFFGFCLGLFITFPWMVASASVAYRDLYGLDDPNRTLH